MRISDWSSDVCSSDLLVYVLHPALLRHLQAAAQADGEQSQTFGNDAGQYGRALTASGYEQAENAIFIKCGIILIAQGQHLFTHRVADEMGFIGMSVGQPQIGRASCRERVCQYV